MLAGLVLLVALAQPKAIEFASPAQGAAWHHGPTPMCMSGGWGSGKTWLGCMKGLWLSDTFPRNRGVIFRRVAKELRATTMSTFFKVCPKQAYDPKLGGRRNDQEGYVKLAGSGSEILFMHLEDPDVQGIIKGLEINWFLGDQMEDDPEHMEEIFDLMLGRLGRWDVTEVPQWLIDAEHAAGREWKYFYPDGRPMPPPYAMLACNPDVEFHWIYRRFHPESHEHQKDYAPRGYKLFEIHSLENKFLPDTNKELLLAHDDAFKRRNVYGQWGLPEGAIHTIAPESILEGSFELLDYFRQTCTLHRILDHGDSAPTCCLWAAVDKNGNVFVYREYYLPNALISTHRQNITALSEYERYEFNLADPSIFHKEMQKHGGRWSVSDEYSDNREHPAATALHWSPADNNELGTRNRVNEYLRVEPSRVHPITRTLGSPRLFFVRANPQYPQGCVHAIQQTRSQRRVKIGTDLGRPLFSDERDEGITDHAYDCVRYLIASRPPVFVEQGATATPGTFAFAQQRKQQQIRKVR